MKLYAVPQLDDHIDCNIQVLLATQMETLAKKNNIYVLWTKKISATLLIKIPKEYKDFQRLFELEENKNFLPPYQPWDHKIKFEEGKQLGKYTIYLLSDFKLETLMKYLDENLRYGFIWES